MKKLMFAAALISAATTFAVESGIVGYQSNNLVDGTKMIAPTFVPVTGDEAIDLLDIKLGGTFNGGEITIQTLTTSGIRDKAYTYMYSTLHGNWYWSDGSKKITEKGEVTFEPGVGLWIYGVEAANVTFAGAVSTADRKVALKNGAIASGNMTAVTIDLLDITPENVTSGGQVTIQTLTPDGTRDKAYTLMYSTLKKDWYWSDGSKKLVRGDVTFAPGEGMWIYGIDGAFLTFPGPEL